MLKKCQMQKHAKQMLKKMQKNAKQMPNANPESLKNAKKSIQNPIAISSFCWHRKVIIVTHICAA